MNSGRLRLVMLSMLGVGVILFLVTVIVGLSIVSKKSKELVDTKIRYAVVDADVRGLSAAKKEVDKYSFFHDIARTVLPPDKNQTQAISDLFQFAQESGFSLQSVTFPSSTLGSKPQTSTTSEKAAVTDPKSTSSSQAISQAKPVPGITGLYSLQITVAPATGSQVANEKMVTYPKLINFLNRLERNRRTAQITQLIINPMESGETNFTLTLNIFIKP